MTLTPWPAYPATHAMRNPQARRALTDSALALLLGTAALVSLLPGAVPVAWRSGPAGPLEQGLATGLLLLCAPLHWRWLAAGARRLGLAARGWLALAVLLFPLGGAAALLLLLGVEAGEGRRAGAPSH